MSACGGGVVVGRGGGGSHSKICYMEGGGDSMLTIHNIFGNYSAQPHTFGYSRKYPYPLTDSFHILTPPPLPSEIPKCITPPCPRNSIIVNPPPVRIFPFFAKPFRITGRVHKYWRNLAYFTPNYFKWLHFCYSGVIMTPEIMEWKF